MYGEFDFEERHFSGRSNVAIVMEWAVRAFPLVKTLVVTGESAGGFGATINYDFIRSHWSGPGYRGILLDDSGPVLDDEAVSPCLQGLWRTTWNINASLPAGCPCVGNAGNMASVWKYLMEKYPTDSFGLISSVQDIVISAFFSFGENQCSGLLPTTYTKLGGGLQRIASTGVPVFMIPGIMHTHTGDKDTFYTESSTGVPLYKWVAQLVNASEPNPPTVDPSPPSYPCAECINGRCGLCKGCISTKTGACATCWAKNRTTGQSCLYDDGHGCQQCWNPPTPTPTPTPTPPPPPGSCAAAWHICGTTRSPTCCDGACTCTGPPRNQCIPPAGQYKC